MEDPKKEFINFVRAPQLLILVSFFVRKTFVGYNSYNKKFNDQIDQELFRRRVSNWQLECDSPELEKAIMRDRPNFINKFFKQCKAKDVTKIHHQLLGKVSSLFLKSYKYFGPKTNEKMEEWFEKAKSLKLFASSDEYHARWVELCRRHVEEEGSEEEDAEEVEELLLFSYQTIYLYSVQLVYYEKFSCGELKSATGNKKVKENHWRTETSKALELLIPGIPSLHKTTPSPLFAVPFLGNNVQDVWKAGLANAAGNFLNIHKYHVHLCLCAISYLNTQVYVDASQLKHKTLITLLNHFRQVNRELEEENLRLNNSEKEYRSRHRNQVSSPQRKKQRTRKKIIFEDDSHLVPKVESIPCCDKDIMEHSAEAASPYEKQLGYQMT